LCSTETIGATQLVVHEAADTISCRNGSYSCSLTPTTNVASTFLPGAEMSTRFAPAFRCAAASSRVRSLPVASMTRSTDSSPQPSRAGSFCVLVGIRYPPTVIAATSCAISPWKRPNVETYAISCASVAGSHRSLIATMSMSLPSRPRPYTARRKLRPIRPNPLIATR
jgi:hypothetical protein